MTLGAFAIRLVAIKGIDMGPELDGIARIIYPAFSREIGTFCFVAGTAVSLLGAFYPALVASRMKPLQPFRSSETALDILKLAIRNVARNRRRTILDMAAFVVCLSMVSFFVELYRFRILDGVDKATRFCTGHLQVHAAGYDAVARKLPLNVAISKPAEVNRVAEADPRVRLASERIRFFLYISHGDESLQ